MDLTSRGLFRYLVCSIKFIMVIYHFAAALQVPAREDFLGATTAPAPLITSTDASSSSSSTTSSGSTSSVVAKRQTAHVVGTLCENNDWFAHDRDLPADAAVGE